MVTGSQFYKQFRRNSTSKREYDTCSSSSTAPLTGTSTTCKLKPKMRKIILMGYRMVGKSTLASRFVGGGVAGPYIPTIEHTWTKAIKIKEEDFDVKIIDTAGQHFSLFPSHYATYGDGFVFVYSVNDRRSFQVVRDLLENLFDLVQPVQVPIVLIANKNDLSSDQRQVKYEDGLQLAQEMHAQFFELSALRNVDQVIDLFEDFITSIDYPKVYKKPTKWKSFIGQIGQNLAPSCLDAAVTINYSKNYLKFKE